jgi:uncharacterized phage protein (TIGR02216 family)
VLSLGLGTLRLSPEAFWALSLVEWRAILAASVPHTAAPLARREFESLMQEFPDG